MRVETVLCVAEIKPPFRIFIAEDVVQHKRSCDAASCEVTNFDYFRGGKFYGTGIDFLTVTVLVIARKFWPKVLSSKIFKNNLSY